MKIMHFHFGRDGGAERFFVQLANALATRNVEQCAIIRPDRSWRSSLDSNIGVHEGVWRRYTPDRWSFEYRRRQLIAGFQPDVLMSWMTRAARSMPDLPQYVRVARMGDYPANLDYFHNVDVIVCNTPDIARHIVSMGWKRRCETISNFTDSDPVHPASRAALRTPESAFVIAAAGRFVRRKGFHTLVEAMPHIPEAILWMVGDGEERAKLEAQAGRLHVADRIRWTGWQHDPKPFLAAADVLAMPSVHEPLGNVILEGWAANIPIVASRCEGALWLISPEKDGLLFDIEDPLALSDAINRVRTAPALANRLADTGSETLETRFSQEAVCQSYLQLFEDCLRDKARQPAS